LSIGGKTTNQQVKRAGLDTSYRPPIAAYYRLHFFFQRNGFKHVLPCCRSLIGAGTYPASLGSLNHQKFTGVVGLSGQQEAINRLTFPVVQMNSANADTASSWLSG